MIRDLLKVTTEDLSLFKEKLDTSHILPRNGNKVPLATMKIVSWNANMDGCYLSPKDLHPRLKSLSKILKEHVDIVLVVLQEWTTVWDGTIATEIREVLGDNKWNYEETSTNEKGSRDGERTGFVYDSTALKMVVKPISIKSSVVSTRNPVMSIFETLKGTHDGKLHHFGFIEVVSVHLKSNNTTQAQGEEVLSNDVYFVF